MMQSLKTVAYMLLGAAICGGIGYVIGGSTLAVTAGSALKGAHRGAIAGAVGGAIGGAKRSPLTALFATAAGLVVEHTFGPSIPGFASTASGPALAYG
jgi:hypothetical protein